MAIIDTNMPEETNDIQPENKANIENILRELNPEQRRAATTTEGPLVIQAGAGSGKTKTLVHRIAYIMATKKATKDGILAVTFTNKAAGEMRDRLNKLLNESESFYMPWMGTFHAISIRLLRKYGTMVDVDPQFVIYDRTDSKTIIRDVLRKLNYGSKRNNLDDMMDAISKAKSACLSPEELYESSAHREYDQMIYRVFKEYDQKLQQNCALDFDDLLFKTVELLVESEPIKKKLQEQFKYILIDEYQDTNAVQCRMVTLLAGDCNNVCAVGDDWQSIYSWRGAEFTNILNFSNDFSNATSIKLEQNYRSTASILDAAHKVISNNSKRSEKKLWTKRGKGEPVDLVRAENERAEANKVVQIIRSYVSAEKYKYSDFAVLYRTNAQSRVIEQACMREGIPYKIIGGFKFYLRNEVKDMMAFLNVAFQPLDTASFKRIATKVMHGFGEVGIEKLDALFDMTGQGVIDTLDSPIAAIRFSGIQAQELHKYTNLLKELRDMSKTERPDKLIKRVIEVTDFYEHVRNDIQETREGGAEDRIRNIEELIEAAHEHENLESFLREASLASSIDIENKEDAITLMTIHAAKGLEYPVVIMTGMEDGVFPMGKALANPEELAEERRLCYVGMTRAKDKLFLTYACRRRRFGGEGRCYPVSCFVREAGLLKDECPPPSPPKPMVAELNIDIAFGAASDCSDGTDIVEDTFTSNDTSNDTPNDFKKPQYNLNSTKSNKKEEPHYSYDAPAACSNTEHSISVGARVKHRELGEGTVEYVEGNLIEVYFDNGSVVDLDIESSPIELC